MHNNILLIGPTSVGKKVTYQHLKEHLGVTIENIETGRLIRDRGTLDEEFRKQWWQRLERGELLPDNVVFDLAASRRQEILSHPEVSWIYYDGIPRGVPQLKELVRRDFISAADSLVIFLNASHETCRHRFVHRLKNATDGIRPEAKLEVFHRRYHEHRTVAEAMQRTFIRYRFTIRQIDADRPLSDFPADILAAARAHWGMSVYRGTPPKQNLPPFQNSSATRPHLAIA